MFLSVGWSCDGLTLPFAVVIGSWEDSFDTSVSFRDIENQNGDYSNGMGLQTDGLYRGQLDTQEVSVRVTVEFFPWINELSSDLYHFLKKAKISN